MTKEQLLIEVEDVLRTMPPGVQIIQHNDENTAWLGRASAVIRKWEPRNSGRFGLQLASFDSPIGDEVATAVRNIRILLHDARNELRMDTLGPLSTAIASGMVFDYFDEIRKTIELARQDLLFVDPYLDADFVSQYLPHVAAGVLVRLLTREKLVTLLPSVDAFSKQSGLKVEVRSAPGFHDRYVFVDKSACYHSGASFKDGAKRAPTTITQITDAFPAVWQTYETLWNGARVER